MSETPYPPRLLETLSGLLLRCWIAGFIFVTVWFLAITLGSGIVVPIYREMLGVRYDQIILILGFGIILTKLLVIVLFLIPWISIRLYLRKTAR